MKWRNIQLPPMDVSIQIYQPRTRLEFILIGEYYVYDALFVITWFVAVFRQIGQCRWIHFVRWWTDYPLDAGNPHEHHGIPWIYPPSHFENRSLRIRKSTGKYPKRTHICFNMHRVCLQNQFMLPNYFFLYISSKSLTRLFEYGVVMEVYETSYRRDTINLKAIGRQRCQIISSKEVRLGRIYKVSVRVLGEPTISSPIASTELQSLKQRRSTSVCDYETMMKNYRYRRWATVFFINFGGNWPISRYHLSQYPQTSWIYDQNELCFYIKHILDGLSKFYHRQSIPTDPVLLSYWFVQNFQLTHNERLVIMKCNNVLERLKKELFYMKLVKIFSCFFGNPLIEFFLFFYQEERQICCASCDMHIAKQSDVFAMSKEGVQSNYCNQGGQVYETVTVLKADNFTLVGQPSKQFTWFPG